MSRDIRLTLEGTEGIFRVEKTIGLFHSHVTEKEVTGTLQAVKKELGKMVKSKSVMFTITSTDSHSYGDMQSHYRFTFSGWFNRNNVLTLESRKFNGYDFSDIQELHFTNMNDLLKYVIMSTKHQIVTIMDSIPETTSRFSTSLNEKYGTPDEEEVTQ